MRHIKLRAFFLLIFAIIAAPAVVQSAAQAPSTLPQSVKNIAAISFNTAVLDTNEARAKLEELRKKFAPREARIKQMNDDLNAMKSQMDASANALSEAEKAARVQALQDKDKQLQREMEDYKSDSQTEANQAVQAIGAKVYAFLQKYAKERGYVCVLERGSEENPLVWYAAENVDITAAVVQAYNLQSSAAASAVKSHPQ